MGKHCYHPAGGWLTAYMKILITGITGFLGPYLRSEFAKNPENEILGVARGIEADLSYDLSDAKAAQHMMERADPDMVIHAAAMTDVNKCQEKPKEAWANNVTAVKNIVQYMPLRGKLIYISSDAVYSGLGPHIVGGHTENPLNVYGMTKFMGEFEAAKFPNHLIVRTNMYGLARGRKRSSSLVDFLIDSLKSGRPFNIFTDAIFSPLYVGTLAQMIRRRSEFTTGTINLGSSNGISKSKFALVLAHHLSLSAEGAVPIASAGLEGRVPRSLDTRLYPAAPEAPTVESDIFKMCEAIKACRVV